MRQSLRTPRSRPLFLRCSGVVAFELAHHYTTRVGYRLNEARNFQVLTVYIVRGDSSGEKACSGKTRGGAAFVQYVRKFRNDPPLRVVLYNCQSLKHGRLTSIVAELNADIIILTGTGYRAWGVPEKRRMSTESLPRGYNAIHFGWQPGPFTNKSAGCAIVYGRRIKKVLVQIGCRP